jgi:hypothetical protein
MPFGSAPKGIFVCRYDPRAPSGRMPVDMCARVCRHPDAGAMNRAPTEAPHRVGVCECMYLSVSLVGAQFIAPARPAHRNFPPRACRIAWLPPRPFYLKKGGAGFLNSAPPRNLSISVHYLIAIFRAVPLARRTM